MKIGVEVAQFVDRGGRDPATVLPLRLPRIGDDVHQRAVAQREMDEETIGSDVEALDPGESFRKAGRRYQRPKANLASESGRRRAEDHFPHGRSPAVTADQHLSPRNGAVGEPRHDTVSILSEIDERPIQMDAIGIIGEHRGAEGIVKVRAMNLKVASAIPRHVGIAWGTTPQHTPAAVISDFQRVRQDRCRGDRFGNAEKRECMHRVRRDDQAGTDLAQPPRPLEDRHLRAVALQ